MVNGFAGIYAVLYALFDAQERLDREAMCKQVSLCKQAGVQGVTVLGLATEVAKLTFEERCDLIHWAAADLNGELPLSVTIAGNSVAEQVALIRVAEAMHADWLILQPPVAGTYPAVEYMAFFGRVAGSTRLPVAIQNAPAYLGRGLSNEEIVSLNETHPNICLLKAEETAAGLLDLVQRSNNRMTIFNGRGGLEMPAVLAAGAHGMIIAPDMVDHAVRIYSLWKSGNTRKAEASYIQALPAIEFVMRSIEHLITYGKRLFGLRAGIAIHDRAPCLHFTANDLEHLGLLAKAAGPFERQ